MENKKVHLAGIRHHGPGSARSVLKLLEKVKPDLILVEGPADLTEIMPFFNAPKLKPPIAFLAYSEEKPRLASFYPFAIYSPEFQTIKWAIQNNTHCKFFDLPQTHSLALRDIKMQEMEKLMNTEEILDLEKKEEIVFENEIIEKNEENQESVDLFEEIPPWHRDPIGYLAELAGFTDSERWWENMIEQRHNETSIFEVIHEAMTALRQDYVPKDEEILREAWMREEIRKALKEGYNNIVVVCGAWHTPSLENLEDAKIGKDDKAVLKSLPKLKLKSSWVPWTYERLQFASGYGAGIEAPSWYEHLWNYPDGNLQVWFTKASHLLRTQSFDISPAHVIEAVRLTEALTALRDLPMPGLKETHEALITTMGLVYSKPYNYVFTDLLVGKKMGVLPDEAPILPIKADFNAITKKLRIPIIAENKTIELDLREENPKKKSAFFNRLAILGVSFATKISNEREIRGTNIESWDVKFKPEIDLDFIECSMWGNTVESAAINFIISKIKDEKTDLKTLVGLIENTLHAELPSVLPTLIKQIEDSAATSNDIGDWMSVLPGLAAVSRYGDVRKTNVSNINEILKSLAIRIIIQLPMSVAHVQDATAHYFRQLIRGVHNALKIYDNEEVRRDWLNVLIKIESEQNTHAWISGSLCRLLLDEQKIEFDHAYSKMTYATSVGQDLMYTAYWLEGFLQGNVQLLLHAPQLLVLIHNWLKTVNEELFMEVLPLLRRAFSDYSLPERNKIMEAIKIETGFKKKEIEKEKNFNEEWAKLPLGTLINLICK